MNKKVWGHRGCRGAGYPPENSLSAFQAALDAGVGGLEFDIHLSKDGVPVVFHDATLERITGAKGEIGSLSLVEIKKLRLRTTDGRTSKDTIPTLAEVLELVDRYRLANPSFVLNIELKDPRSVEAVARLIEQRVGLGWTYANFLISSFDMTCLRAMKVRLPAAPRGTLFECGASELAAKLLETADVEPTTINIPASALTAASFELIVKAGATPVVWSPKEINPSQLLPVEREKLLQNIRERDFVTITDFPRELLQWLKPSRTKATVTGVLAACLAVSQQDMLFCPTESGLETLKAPSEYPELQRFGFRELPVTAEDGVTFTVWERRGALDRPHYLLFHGNRAHWGDTGVGDITRDRRARLKFVAELAASGAGVTAVTLRGFGKSAGLPSESGFLLDLRAVSDQLIAGRLNHQNLVMAGESLGTWAATQTAVFLTQRQTPPALLSLQNPFTSMAEVGEQVLLHFPLVRSLNIGLSAASLDRHVLKSHFYTAKLLRELSSATVLHIATSGRDGLVHPSHSDRLAEIAEGKNLRVVRDVFAEAFHSTIPPIEYAKRLICLGEQCCRRGFCAGELWGDPWRTGASVDHLPYL